jgi:hypothetical protein
LKHAPRPDFTDNCARVIARPITRPIARPITRPDGPDYKRA